MAGLQRIRERALGLRESPRNPSCLERSPANTSPSVGSWQNRNPATGSSEDIRRGGRILEHALTKCLRARNDAIKSLCSAVRRFRDASVREECKPNYPQALQAMLKALS